MALAASAVSNAALSTTQANYYSTVGIEALRANLAFLTLTTPKNLPMNSGKTIQFFSYPLTPFIASASAGTQPTAATEGTVGSGLVPTAPSVSATIGQYVDYVTIADLTRDIAIDPVVENLSKLLGYRAALIVDTITQMEFDAAVGIDSTTNVDIADKAYLTASVVRSQAASLYGRNVRPFDDNMLHGIIHPFVAGDLFNDNANNGMTDILKRNVDGQGLIQAGWGAGHNFEVVDVAGIRFVQSTNVPTTTGVPVAGATAYSCYIAGQDAVFSVNLGSGELPDSSNYKAQVKELLPSASDPANVIRSAVSFNLRYVAAPRPGSGAGSQAFKRIRVETQNS